MSARVQADLIGAGHGAGLRHVGGDLGLFGDHHEQAIGVVDRETAAGRRRARAHQHRPPLAPGLRLAVDVLQIEILAVVVERPGLGIDLLEDRHPFGRIVVALVVLAKRNSEHRELFDVPAGHDVDPKPPLADVVRGHDRLGGEDRMNKRNMDGRERDDVFRGSQQAPPPTTMISKLVPWRSVWPP